MEKPAELEAQEELSIEETMDMFEYANAVMDDLADAKEDDGKISTAELAGTFASNIPAAIRAYAGSSKINAELKNLNDEEMMKLAMEGSKLAKKILSLVMSSKKKDAES